MKRILVTRQAEQAGDFVNVLSARGLLPFVLPLIETVPVSSVTTECNEYDYVIFTSPNAVKYFAPHLVRVAVGKTVTVGTGTAAALERYTGSSPDLMPSAFSSEGLNALFGKTDLTGKRFLIPGAQVRAGNTGDYLAAKGATVDSPTIYTTEYVTYEPGEFARLLEKYKIDAITLCSPSAAKSLHRQMHLADCTTPLIAIGTTTADEITRLGGTCRYPERFTLADMAELILSL